MTSTEKLAQLQHHPRSAHREYESYDALAEEFPYLRPALIAKDVVDYKNSVSQQLLTRALLEKHYGIAIRWKIPKGVLCPPVPRSSNYVHFVADLFSETERRKLRGFDIGVGYSCIFPLLGKACYDWEMAGSDIDKDAVIEAGEKLRKFGAILRNNMRSIPAEEDVCSSPSRASPSAVTMHVQAEPLSVFRGVVSVDDKYAFCMCNPPFHESAAYARRSNVSRWGGWGGSCWGGGSSETVKVAAGEKEDRDVGRRRSRETPRRLPSSVHHTVPTTVRSRAQSTTAAEEDASLLKPQHGGRENELCCMGGELGFALRMLAESLEHLSAEQIIWYTIMFSRFSSVQKFRLAIETKGRTRVHDFRVIDIKQGKQTVWVVCWSLLHKADRETCLGNREYHHHDGR